MLHKSFDIVEAKADGETGTFEALVAVFGNVDSVGDRIVPGAFSKTLEKWRATGDPIPVILSHKHDDPMAHIGVASPNDVVETEKGLLVKGQLDVKDNEVARQVHRLMKRRSLKEFSFGYRVPKGGEKRASDGANELTEIDLIETGPTLKGANPATELHAVKSALETEAAEKAAAAEKAELEGLREKVAQLERQLKEEQEKKADPDKEPPRARSADPLRKRSDRALLDLQLEGVSRRQSPIVEEQQPKARVLPEEELKRRSRDVMLEVLIGSRSEET